MKILSIIVLLILYFSIPSFATTEMEYYPVDIPLKRLLKAPTLEAESALDFPIDVNIVGVSKDKKWYKVYIRYDLVFFGKYTFTGWINADVFGLIKGVTAEVVSY